MRMRRDGHSYFDDQCFPAVALLRRLRERLSQLGIKIPDQPDDHTYVSDSHSHVEIPKPAGGARTLSIPSMRDRAVQRVVLPVIADGIDAFLESSAMAYR